MKNRKVLLFGLMAVLSLGFTACKKGEETSSASSKEETMGSQAVDVIVDGWNEADVATKYDSTCTIHLVDHVVERSGDFAEGGSLSSIVENYARENDVTTEYPTSSFFMTKEKIENFYTSQNRGIKIEFYANGKSGLKVHCSLSQTASYQGVIITMSQDLVDIINDDGLIESEVNHIEFTTKSNGNFVFEENVEVTYTKL